MMRTRGASTELQESIYDGHGSDVEAAAGSTKAGGEYGTGKYCTRIHNIIYTVLPSYCTAAAGGSV